MRIAAYQFGITGLINKNTEVIKKAICLAADRGAELVVFPECAVTGYPPRDIQDSKAVDIEAVQGALKGIKESVDRYDIHVIVGTVEYDGTFYNRAYILSPGRDTAYYDKRALYGWDEENFTPGNESGFFSIGDFKIGVRICFEVRFPEYFRELYKERTDLNIVLFYDVSDEDSTERYDMIRGHLITRAVENVTPVLAVNAAKKYSTAPTCFIDASGHVIREQERDTEGMLIYDLEKKEPDFGELGRIKYSDKLVRNV